MKIALVTVLLAAAAVVFASPAAPMQRKPVAPVIKLKDARFGNILATPRHQALYYWSVEKRAGEDPLHGCMRGRVAAARRQVAHGPCRPRRGASKGSSA